MAEKEACKARFGSIFILAEYFQSGVEDVYNRCGSTVQRLKKTEPNGFSEFLPTCGDDPGLVVALFIG